MHRRDDVPLRLFPLRLLLAFSCLALGLILGGAILSLPSEATGLARSVQADLKESGVENRVTAVLLNFRSYDTLLEIGVLLLAVMGTWSLPALHKDEMRSGPAIAGPGLLGFVRLLTPLMVVIAGYLLWLGSDSPGGAFQGGVVLGGAWILLLLAGSKRKRLSIFQEGRLRVSLVFGFVFFLAVSVGVMGATGQWFEYPRAWAKGLILLIEAALALSIGFTLAALFLGRPPGPSETVASRGPEGIA